MPGSHGEHTPNWAHCSNEYPELELTAREPARMSLMLSEVVSMCRYRCQALHIREQRGEEHALESAASQQRTGLRTRSRTQDHYGQHEAFWPPNLAKQELRDAQSISESTSGPTNSAEELRHLAAVG